MLPTILKNKRKSTTNNKNDDEIDVFSKNKINRLKNNNNNNLSNYNNNKNLSNNNNTYISNNKSIINQLKNESNLSNNNQFKSSKPVNMFNILSSNYSRLESDSTSDSDSELSLNNLISSPIKSPIKSFNINKNISNISNLPSANTIDSIFSDDKILLQSYINSNQNIHNNYNIIDINNNISNINSSNISPSFRPLIGGGYNDSTKNKIERFEGKGSYYSNKYENKIIKDENSTPKFNREDIVILRQGDNNIRVKLIDYKYSSALNQVLWIYINLETNIKTNDYIIESNFRALNEIENNPLFDLSANNIASSHPNENETKSPKYDFKESQSQFDINNHSSKINQRNESYHNSEIYEFKGSEADSVKPANPKSLITSEINYRIDKPHVPAFNIRYQNDDINRKAHLYSSKLPSANNISDIFRELEEETLDSTTSDEDLGSIADGKQFNRDAAKKLFFTPFMKNNGPNYHSVGNESRTMTYQFEKHFTPIEKKPIESRDFLSNTTSINSGYNSYSSTYNSYENEKYLPKSYTPGVCGLVNLGNTCFMNSGLQCLSNSAKLTNYFLKDSYKNDINRNNPLSRNGEMAEVYGDLINKIWSGKFASLSPSNFKYVLGKFAPQFMGYNQHDSQEFLSFLLDGLHEDLNKVTNKPYLKAPENLTDDIMSEKSWNNHIARNKSIIVDLFHGQIKSTVICPDCNYTSITFDPFMYLSLPLESEFELTFILATIGSVGFKAYKMAFKQSNTVSDLIAELSSTFVDKEVELICRFDFNANTKLFPIQDKLGILLSAFKNKNPLLIYFAAKPDEADSLRCIETILTNSDLERDLEQIGTDNISSSNSTFIEQVLRPECVEPGLDSKIDKLPHYLPVYFKTSASYCKAPIILKYLPSEHVIFDILQMIQNIANSISINENELIKSCEVTIVAWNQFCGLKNCRCNSCRGTFKTVCICRGCNLGDFEKDLNFDMYNGFLAINTTYYILENQINKYFDIVNSDLFTKKSVNSIKLDDCIKSFLSSEILKKDEAWHCSKCKEFKCATKKLDFWRLPEILIIHLKRFQFSSYHSSKISTVVDFPLESLDLTEYISSSSNNTDNAPIYDLFAVSNHMGGTSGGHYTATCKNVEENKWYNFNDSIASICNETNIVSSSAYVLFYKQRNVNKTINNNT